MKVSESQAGVSPTSFQSWIPSTHLYPYVVVIEKAESCPSIHRTQARTRWQPFDTLRKKSSG